MFNNLLIAAADLNRISLASWDWIVIAIFFLAMVWICWDVSRKKKETSGDYFLSGRSATWIAIGASIFASNIGSEHLIGLAGTGASAGMAQAHWEIQGWMILILGWVFVPFYERSMVYTMPEFLEKRYNKESRGILTWLSLASYVLTKVSVTVLAGGLAHRHRRHGIRPEDFRPADADPAHRFPRHPVARSPRTRRLERDDGHLRRPARQ